LGKYSELKGHGGSGKYEAQIRKKGKIRQQIASLCLKING